METKSSKSSIGKVKISIKEDGSASEMIEYFQEAGNWRNIIFLPQNFFWKFLIVVTIVINCLLVFYRRFFTRMELHSWFSTTYYILEIFYFANVVLVLMHRYMIYRKTQVYLPKPLGIVVIDIITLLPYYEVYYLLQSKSKISTKHLATDYTRFKVIGRLVTVAYFFHNTSNEPGLNHIVLITVKQFIVFSLYTMCVCGVWFNWRNYDVAETWTKCLKYHQFNNNSLSSWFVISYTTIGNCMAHNSAGVIHARNIFEASYVVTTMVIGYLLHIMIYFGELITAYIKKISDQFEFSYRLQVVTRMLDNWSVETSVKSHIIDAYNILWEKRLGRRKLPKLFYILPKSLQRQCTLDSFWYFLMHSQLFADMDLPFIRNLSLSMECHYYMPGEYLYKLNELKTRMVYIVSGVIQILSQEDQDSPVMSFSGGTVLSEICCLIGTYSNVNIRCASYCEIQTLDMRQLHRLLTKYPLEKRVLHLRINERLRLARKMQHPELLKLKHKEQKRTSIKWIKTQWRNISHTSKSTKRNLEDQQKYIVPHHVSKFLNLYALSDDVELKVAAICLNSKCPFVLEPSSSFRAACDYVLLFSAIIQSIMIPYLAVFKRSMNNQERGLLYMLDVIYVTGLYIEFSTAVKVSGRLISKVHEIIIYKMKQTNILIDISSSIPLEFFGFLTSTDPQMEILMHMNRVLKIYRLFRLIVVAELNVWRSYIRIRLIKFSFLFIFFLYFLSCFHYFHTCYNKCERIGWYHYNRYLVAILKSNASHEIPPFIASFDYVSSILISLTWNDNYPYSIKDMIIEHLIVLLGYYLFSFCFAQLGACAVLQLRANSEYQLYLKGLKHFLMRKIIPNNMRQLIYTMIQCQWQYNDRHEISGPKGILSDLPSHLIDKVFIQRVIRCMKLSPFFIHCEDSTIAVVAKLAKASILPPGTIIMRESTVCTELNFILRGYCQAESEIPTDKYHQTCTILTTGDCFPLMEMLMEIRTFLKVTAVTFVEMITIPHKELTVHLKRSLDFYHDLKLGLGEHMKENEIVLTRQKGKLPELVAKIKSKGVGDFFTYETNEEVGIKEDALLFEKTFDVLGKWKILRHIMLRHTFIPTKSKYITWEIFRCLISFIQVVYVVFFMKFTLILKLHRPLERVFTLIAIVDFYIKLHTCYYNKDGILVTHPLYTSLNYIKTSLLLDFIAIFPFGELQVHHMFGHKLQHHSLLLMASVTRPLLFYRIFNGITYMEKRSKEGRAILFYIVKYVLLVFVILAVLALFLLALSCTGEDNTTAIICSNDSWIESDELLLDDIKSYTNTLVSYYAVLSIFVSCVVSLYTFRSKGEIIFMMVMAFTLFAVRWFVLAKITSSRIGGNTMLVHYQHNMKVLLKFAKQNYVSNNLVNEIVSHYEYIWKRTKGYTSTSILRSFHPVLTADFTHYLYSKTFKLCEIFKGLEPNAIRFISAKFEELHFKKDACIIRCNDVGNTIYIVYKGTVEISVANDKLCTLTPGGIFGCLKLNGMTRQTICAKAVIHVDLLAIECTLFNRVIANFPQIKRKLRRAMFLNTEYILPTGVSSACAIHEFDQIEDVKRGIVNTIKHFLISMDNIWYQTYSYIVNVHIATISSLLTSSLIVQVGEYDIINYYFYMHFIDIIFAVKIFIGFRLSYVDPESGVQVKVFSSIWRRYIKSATGFWLDLFTCLPFELIASFMNHDELYRYLWLNRTFRFLFMIKYYNNCKNTLIVSKNLRWSYLMYTLLLMLNLMILLWWRVACIGEVCTYNEYINHEKIVFRKTNDTFTAFTFATQYVINIFSGTGIRTTIPTTSTQLIAAIFMVCIAQFTQLSLTIGFASMLLLDKLVMANYAKEAEHVLQYVKATNLSLMLRSKIWKYYVMLWTRSQGSWVPHLVKDSPSYLKQDIMGELYRKCIESHFLFKKTHVDFIRQLVVHLDLCLFMPGMYIVEKGDIDGCMYFIQEGEVIVYDKHGNNEIEQLVLTAGKSFGEVQGLYESQHDRSYKTRFVCKILILERAKWWYLLDWFPASKAYMFEQVARHFRKTYLAAPEEQ